MVYKKAKTVYYPQLFWFNKISIVDKTKKCNDADEAIKLAKRMRKDYEKKFIVGFKKVNLFKD